MPKKTQPYTHKEVEAILAQPGNAALRKYVYSKAGCALPSPEAARRGLLQLFSRWLPKSLEQEVVSNQKKLDIVFKTWKEHFFTYGLEAIPESCVRNEFVAVVKQKLMHKKLNDKSYQDRHHAKKGTPLSIDLTDHDQEDHYNMQSAKLSNNRTVRKNIVPRVSTGGSPTDSFTVDTTWKEQSPPEVRRTNPNNIWVRKAGKMVKYIPGSVWPEPPNKKPKTTPECTSDISNKENSQKVLSPGMIEFLAMNQLPPLSQLTSVQGTGEDSWSLPSPTSSVDEHH